jgi:hypothetical protein
MGSGDLRNKMVVGPVTVNMYGQIGEHFESVPGNELYERPDSVKSDTLFELEKSLEDEVDAVTSRNYAWLLRSIAQRCR